MTTTSDTFHPGAGECRFISVARLLLVCGLVWHHLYELPGSFLPPRGEFFGAVHPVPEFLNTFVHMLFMAAVPVLSLLTGFLVYRHRSLGYGRQLKNYFQAIALPSWIWASLWLGLAFALYSAGLREGGFAWTDYGFSAPALATLIDGVFGNSRIPLAIQFWFVHDLMLTLLLSPLLFWALRRFGGWLILGGIPVWLMLESLPLFYYSHLPAFFVLGAWLALPEGPGLLPLLERIKGFTCPAAAAFVAVVLARMLAHEFGPAGAFLGSYAFLCLIRVLGALALALTIYELSKHDIPLVRLLMHHRDQAFFIYAAHFPLIELYQSFAAFIPGHDSAWGMLVSWLSIPLLTIATCIWLSQALRAWKPALHRLLDGTVKRGPVRGRVPARSFGLEAVR